jgi:phage regulator Rha-like protein
VNTVPFVLLDTDLAELYGVPTKALNQAVRRNLERFPKDLMFRLNPEEKEEVVTNCDHLKKLKFSPVLPFVFTEHGALMLANVLNSKRAVQMSIFIVRTFIKLRELLLTHEEMIYRLARVEHKLGKHDREIQELLEAIRKLTERPQGPVQAIGFQLTTTRPGKIG